MVIDRTYTGLGNCAPYWQPVTLPKVLPPALPLSGLLPVQLIRPPFWAFNPSPVALAVPPRVLDLVSTGQGRDRSRFGGKNALAFVVVEQHT